MKFCTKRIAVSMMIMMMGRRGRRRRKRKNNKNKNNKRKNNNKKRRTKKKIREQKILFANIILTIKKADRQHFSLAIPVNIRALKYSTLILQNY